MIKAHNSKEAEGMGNAASFEKRDGPGFSLVELLVVVTMTALLAAIAVPCYNRYVMQSRQIEAKTQLLVVAQAEEIFRFSYGQYTADRSLLVNHGWKDVCGKYRFALTRATATTFLAEAVADLDGDGSNDDTWTVDQNGIPVNTVHAW
jgi:type IV pilus assembly protein PilE